MSRLLAGHGAVVVDYDRIAHEVVAPGTPGLAALVAEFGPEVLDDDGALDRQRVADLVFGDPEALQRLNGIVHPLVGAAAAALMAGLPADAIVVHDVPLLVETGSAKGFDVVVVVAASPETQVDRLVGLRGMAEADARARIAAQAPLADKVAVADHVIDNDGPMEALAPQVEVVWADLRRRAER